MLESLSPEQSAALDPDVQLIEAGPGSGKTRTVVARFLDRSVDGGVALLSFTNAAVDVARARAASHPGLSQAPNFVGTFDLFLHRYVVTPYLLRTAGAQAKYVASWDDLPSFLSHVHPNKGGIGIRLSQFVRVGDGWEVDSTALKHGQRAAWEKLTPYTHAQISVTGSARLDSLIANHHYDTSAARFMALKVLRDRGQPFLDRLSQRFVEIIVDELQDCDALEHDLLDTLRSGGVHVVGVADPDQAIYEFRQDSSDSYLNFRDGLPRDSIVSLSTCYRSAPPICALVTSLRSLKADDVQPDPAHAGGASHVTVVIGSGRDVAAKAFAAMAEHGVSKERVRILAHRRADAMALARVGDADPGGVSQMEHLLAAVATLRSSVEGKARHAAVSRVERFVLDQFVWEESPVKAGRADMLESLSLTPAGLRVAVGQLLASADTWKDAKDCRVKTTQILLDLAADRPVELRPNLGRRLAVRANVWKVWMSRLAMPIGSAPTGAIWSHIHGVKGDEFDGVVLAIPSRRSKGSHVLDDWEDEIDSEARRVLYVGASRARSALALVVPESRSQQLLRILTRDRVPHELA